MTPSLLSMVKNGLWQFNLSSSDFKLSRLSIELTYFYSAMIMHVVKNNIGNYSRLLSSRTVHSSAHFSYMLDK